MVYVQYAMSGECEVGNVSVGDDEGFNNTGARIHLFFYVCVDLKERKLLTELMRRTMSVSAEIHVC